MNIVVLGAGTAGWLTALYCRKVYPQSKITVIKNSSKGIIGVGEATTPPFVSFLKFLDIDPLDIIKKVGGTIKNGISFENWNGDGKKYFHGFSERGPLNPFSLLPYFSQDCFDYYLRHLLDKKLDFNENVYCNKISYQDKVDLDNIMYALHFDTNKMSNFLENESKYRNITLIDADYKDVTIDENGFIKTLVLDTQEVQADFVFDCSGLSRLIIEKHFDEEWISYKKHLPMDSAIPFHIPQDYSIHPYTQAISMPHGWIWKIPLQDRYGAGYVFDSTCINSEQAQQEAEEYLGIKLDVNRTIKFEAGRFSRYWIKNCIAVGLSASFIEPLESTSIHLTISQLKLLTQFINHTYEHNENSVKKYNELVTKNMDEILNFVYLHYLCKRSDTVFWKNFRKNYPVPGNFKPMLELIKENNIRFLDTFTVTQDNAFAMGSYYKVSEGLDLFEKPINIKGYENLKPSVYEYKEIIDFYLKNSISHNTLLNNIKD